MQDLYTTSHKSVLVKEVLHFLDLKPGGVYLDATFGSGGHTRAILEKEPTCKVIAMDWDSVALETYGFDLQQMFPNRLKLIWGNFALLYKVLKKENIGKVDGLLADFGTSQVQIANRPGFSIFKETQLDMRMSPSHQKTTAKDVLRDSSEQKLYEIFKQFGEERYAKRIARAIVQERKMKKIRTTKELAQLVERVIPRSKKIAKSKIRKDNIHPATRVFQALRIYVNKELANISAFLPIALKILNPGGRLVCISFHSLEDRIVKDFFRQRAVMGEIKVLTPKVVVASQEELYINRAARSAKLRAAQLVKPSG